MIVWIGKGLILAMHDRQLAEHGGGGGLRDEGLLDSALAGPRQRHAYGDPPPGLAELAASLAFGLARNHPFVDGNKRIAAVASETFLLLNGAELEVDDAELFPIYMALADGRLGEAEIAAWLQQRVRLSPENEVHEVAASYGS